MANGATGHWSDDEYRIVESFLLGGKTAGQISQKLKSRSRSSVLGFIHRNEHLSELMKKKVQKQVGERTVKVAKPRAKVRYYHPPKISLRELDWQEYDATAKNLDLMELTNQTCRYCVDDTRNAKKFCGHQVLLGYPYCPQHAVRCMPSLNERKV